MLVNSNIAALHLKVHHSRDRFSLERNLNFIQKAWNLRSRCTLVQKPTLRFLPGPRVFKEA